MWLCFNHLYVSIMSLKGMFWHFILYSNFLTSHLSSKKYTLSERKFHKEDNGEVNFSPKITNAEKITKNCHFSFETGYKKLKFWKLILNWFIYLQHPIRRCFVFACLFVCFVFSFMPKFYLFAKFSNYWPSVNCLLA